MNRWLTQLTLLILLLLPTAGTAGAHPDSSRVEAALRTIMDDPLPVSAGVVVGVREDREVLAVARGPALIDLDHPERQRPLDPDTPVRVASLSKLSVALTAMMLVEDGRLELDADLSPVLGFRFRNPHYPDRIITARMLLSHTSSLRDGSVYALPVQFSLADLVTPGGQFDQEGTRWAAPDSKSAASGADSAAIDYGPGAWFSYCNLNIGVLATVIERIEGERFEQIIDRRLFRPLEMDAAFDVRRFSNDRFNRLAPVYRGVTGPDGLPAWRSQIDDYRGQRPDAYVNPFGVAATLPLGLAVPGRNATTLSPQGGLRASARDLAQLARLLAGRGTVGQTRLLKPETVSAMLEPAWRYDPSANNGRGNGDTAGGLIRQWGLGVHCTTDTLVIRPDGRAEGDRWVKGDNGPRLCGHFGDAYGLLGGLWVEPEQGWGFVYLLPGSSGDPAEHPSPWSSLSRWEAPLAAALIETLQVPMVPLAGQR
jgi:D-alanyl-D-alanine carboxypeptidase